MAESDRPWLDYTYGTPQGDPANYYWDDSAGKYVYAAPVVNLPAEGMPNDGSGTLSIPEWTPSLPGVVTDAVNAVLASPADANTVEWAPPTTDYIPASGSHYTHTGPANYPLTTPPPAPGGVAYDPNYVGVVDNLGLAPVLSAPPPSGAGPGTGGSSATGAGPGIGGSSIPSSTLAAPPLAPGAAPVAAAPAGLSAGTPYVAPSSGGAVMPGGGGSVYDNGSGGGYGAPTDPYGLQAPPMMPGGGGFGSPSDHSGPFPFGHAGVPNPMPPSNAMRNQILAAGGFSGPAWAPYVPPPPNPLDPVRQGIIDNLSQVPAPPPPPMSPMRYVEAKLGLEPESINPAPPYAAGPQATMPHIPTQEQYKQMFPNNRRAMPPMGGMGY